MFLLIFIVLDDFVSKGILREIDVFSSQLKSISSAITMFPICKKWQQRVWRDPYMVC